MAWNSWFVEAKKWNALCKCIPTFLLDFLSERFAITHYKWNNYFSHCVKVIVSSLQTGTLLYWVSMHPRKRTPINVPSGFSTLYALPVLVFFFTSHVSSRGYRIRPIRSFCLSLLTCLHCAPFQWYLATLCTTNLHCAPPNCVVHHGAERGLNLFRSSEKPLLLKKLGPHGAQRRSIVHNAGWWCATQFCTIAECSFRKPTHTGGTDSITSTSDTGSNNHADIGGCSCSSIVLLVLMRARLEHCVIKVKKILQPWRWNYLRQSSGRFPG